MNVGLHFDLRHSPASPTDPSHLYDFTLEMCEEAESVGCHSIWLSEHHLFDDGYLPQPLTFAAAAAARTKRVRIGTAIVIAPLHHPASIAGMAEPVVARHVHTICTELAPRLAGYQPMEVAS